MTISKLALAITALGAVLLGGSGCSNVGDENPVSPEQMVEIRKKQMGERANFNPGQAQSPGAAGAEGGRPGGR